MCMCMSALCAVVGFQGRNGEVDDVARVTNCEFLGCIDRTSCDGVTECVRGVASNRRVRFVVGRM